MPIFINTYRNCPLCGEPTISLTGQLTFVTDIHEGIIKHKYGKDISWGIYHTQCLQRSDMAPYVAKSIVEEVVARTGCTRQQINSDVEIVLLSYLKKIVITSKLGWYFKLHWRELQKLQEQAAEIPTIPSKSILYVDKTDKMPLPTLYTTIKPYLDEQQGYPLIDFINGLGITSRIHRIDLYKDSYMYLDKTRIKGHTKKPLRNQWETGFNLMVQYPVYIPKEIVDVLPDRRDLK